MNGRLKRLWFSRNYSVSRWQALRWLRLWRNANKKINSYGCIIYYFSDFHLTAVFFSLWCSWPMVNGAVYSKKTSIIYSRWRKRLLSSFLHSSFCTEITLYCVFKINQKKNLIKLPRNKNFISEWNKFFIPGNLWSTCEKYSMEKILRTYSREMHLKLADLGLNK